MEFSLTGLAGVDLNRTFLKLKIWILWFGILAWIQIGVWESGIRYTMVYPCYWLPIFRCIDGENGVIHHEFLELFPSFPAKSYQSRRCWASWRRSVMISTGARTCSFRVHRSLTSRVSTSGQHAMGWSRFREGRNNGEGTLKCFLFKVHFYDIS